MDPDNDLPLMSNTHDIQVRHFRLDLQCDLEASVLKGTCTYFLQPSPAGNNGRVFSIHEMQQKYGAKVPGNTTVLNSSSEIHKDSVLSETDEKPTHSLAACVPPPVVCVPPPVACVPPPVACVPSPVVCVPPPVVCVPVVSSSTVGVCSDTDKCLKNADGGHRHAPASPGTSSDQLQDSKLYPGTDVHEAGHGVTEGSHCSEGESSASPPFKLILDSFDLDIERVEYADLSASLCHTLSSSFHGPLHHNRPLLSRCMDSSWFPLEFTVDRWSLRTWKPGVSSRGSFPRVVRVTYRTRPTGTSLRWTRDQDDRPCMYTSAMFVNNRAFFPCQEFGNLATWQCYMWAPAGAAVLLSGDQPGEKLETKEDAALWYHECRMPLPTFTLAIAIGYWCVVEIGPKFEDCISEDSHDHPCGHDPPCSINYSRHEVMPCRVVAPTSLAEQAATELRSYWTEVSRAVQDLLGPHPFWRVDIVIYPACSQDMAMANPNLIFLSQSLLAGDGSMLIRLAHELTHSWFGLLIGARDWTEEWLSEGFATYMEDWVHGKAVGWPLKFQESFGELRASLRHRVLDSEMSSTQPDLQVLRPNGLEDTTEETGDVLYVKNGLNPNKLFTQVHYLKGYFLLRHLAARVGVEKFNGMIKDFVAHFHGQLVRSRDFLSFCVRAFPELSVEGVSADTIASTWLDSTGMPEALKAYTASPTNELYQSLQDELQKWLSYNRTVMRLAKTRKRRRVEPPAARHDLLPDQLVLLFEELLTSPRLSPSTMRQLGGCYGVARKNADVRHRWCELVVKHRYVAAYEDVRRFLIHDQAMGVYLYGELMITRCPRQRALARECFQQVEALMETSTKALVRQMLYGE